MQVLSIALFSILPITTNATGLRKLVNKVSDKNAANAANAVEQSSAESNAKLTAFLQDLEAPANEDNRKLIGVATDCSTELYWYAQATPGVTCVEGRQCDASTYTAPIACCLEQFEGNIPACLMGAVDVPTESPITSAQLGIGSGATADFFYPDYDTAWPEAGCKNTLPLPFKCQNGQCDRPTYPNQAACCNQAYAGQISKVCLNQIDGYSETDTAINQIGPNACVGGIPGVPFDGLGAACQFTDCCCVLVESVFHALNNGEVRPGNEDGICIRDQGSGGFLEAHTCQALGGPVKTACCVPGTQSPVNIPDILEAPLRGLECVRTTQITPTNSLENPQFKASKTSKPTTSVAPTSSGAPSSIPSARSATLTSPSSSPSVSVAPTTSNAPSEFVPPPSVSPAPTSTCRNIATTVPYDGLGEDCHFADCCCVRAEAVMNALISGDVQIGDEDRICIRDHGINARGGFTEAHNCIDAAGVVVETACCMPGIDSISEPSVIAVALRGLTCSKIN